MLLKIAIINDFMSLGLFLKVTLYMRSGSKNKMAITSNSMWFHVQFLRARVYWSLVRVSKPPSIVTFPFSSNMQRVAINLAVQAAAKWRTTQAFKAVICFDGESEAVYAIRRALQYIIDDVRSPDSYFSKRTTSANIFCYGCLIRHFEPELFHPGHLSGLKWLWHYCHHTKTTSTAAKLSYARSDIFPLVL